MVLTHELEHLKDECRLFDKKIGTNVYDAINRFINKQSKDPNKYSCKGLNEAVTYLMIRGLITDKTYDAIISSFWEKDTILQVLRNGDVRLIDTIVSKETLKYIHLRVAAKKKEADNEPFSDGPFDDEPFDASYSYDLFDDVYLEDKTDKNKDSWIDDEHDLEDLHIDKESDMDPDFIRRLKVLIRKKTDMESDSDIDYDGIEESLAIIDRFWYSDWLLKTLLEDDYLSGHDFDEKELLKFFKTIRFPDWYKANYLKISKSARKTRLFGNRLFFQDYNGFTRMVKLREGVPTINNSEAITLGSFADKAFHVIKNEKMLRMYCEDFTLFNSQAKKENGARDYCCIDILTGDVFTEKKLIFLGTDHVGYEYIVKEGEIMYLFADKWVRVCKYDSNTEYVASDEGLIAYRKDNIERIKWPLIYKKADMVESDKGWKGRALKENDAFTILWEIIIQSFHCFPKELGAHFERYYKFIQGPEDYSIKGIISFLDDFDEDRRKYEKYLFGRARLLKLKSIMEWFIQIGFTKDQSITKQLYSLVKYSGAYAKKYNNKNAFIVLENMKNQEPELLSKLKSSPENTFKKYFCENKGN